VTRLALVTLLVRDYDEAIAFYTQRAGFELVQDTALDGGVRWVVVQPPVPAGAGAGCGLLLARADSPEQAARVGAQTGGRVSLFLQTDDFEGDHARMSSAGVRFLESPRHEPYATVAVFEDLYGNRWDLLQPSQTQ
jgi:catechol 2,3-dioxygenase-like lactoylglutathione lyase family enzyme